MVFITKARNCLMNIQAFECMYVNNKTTFLYFDVLLSKLLVEIM